MAMRKAVLVGCLYPNTSHELRGCINDVKYWKKLLIDRFNFQEDNIQVLTDETSTKPTKDNIMIALNRMIDNAGPEDVFFFFFSGHGTWIPKLCSENQQAIVPLDAVDTMDATLLITSNDIRTLVNKLPLGATITILSDSGRSGGLIEGEKRQFPTSCSESGSHDVVGTNNLVGTDLISKYIPLSLFKSPSTIPSPLMAAIGTNSDGGILHSACQPCETAYDVVPQGATDEAYGAFTGAIKVVLTTHLEAITNRDLLKCVWEKLRVWRIDQHPGLYCSNGNAEAPFLLPAVARRG